MSENELANLALRQKLNDSDIEIERLTLAVSQIPDDHPDMPDLLIQLGISHGDRFDLVSELSEIDKAIEYTAMALTLTPDADQNLPRRLGIQGRYHAKRFQRLGEIDDNDKAIEYVSTALARTPEGHPSLPSLFSNLGVIHSNRFERVGQLNDLEKAIEYGSRAVALTPDDHPELPGLLQNLGLSLRIRFQRLGQLDDLEKAIEHESRVVVLTPDDHLLLSGRLHNCGLSLRIRFQRLGELGDLEKAIEYQSRAIALTPDDHPLLSTELQSLGVSHSVRFRRVGELGDLEKAIEYQSRAVALTPEGHPDLSRRLQNLGLSLRIRFERLGELSDLEKGIAHQSHAVSLTPDGHPDLSGILHNLGVSYSHRFRHLQKQEDLQSAIDWISCAIEIIPHGHPDLPDRHFPLAMFRLFQYQSTGEQLSLQESLYSYRMASQSPSGSPRVKFKYALRWANDASGENYLNPIEAYQTAITLLPQFAWLGATTSQRYEDLTSVGNLAVDAAVAAIHALNNSLALEWLEHARCVVWNQGLMLRSPLDDLYSCHSDLADSIRTVATQLHHSGFDSRGTQSSISGSPAPEQVAQRHHQLAQEYDKLVSQARTLPGFADFLQPMKTASLVRAARYGPVVVINCHEDRCDALTIMPGQDHVDHIPLPLFTGKQARDTRKQMENSIRDTRHRERGAEVWCEGDQKVGFESILADLWYALVKPVLDFLGFMNNPLPANTPHITWCPTGALSFLPLHAAGDYDKPGSRVFDYVISSYTPTLTAILPPSTSGPVTGGPRVLAIAQPNTLGHTKLPGTIEEIEYLQNHASGKLECTQFIGDEATTATVLDAMEQHDWVHLACHAHQNVQDSTKSGFFLHDGTLDLATINRRSFKNKGLAFLSACQTATGDEKLPDEAIHLASGILMAGYSSVIGTMWSVMDDDAPFVADKVYGQLMQDGKVGNGEAGKALHYAVAELRDRVGEEKFGRWVPYIHIGS